MRLPDVLLVLIILGISWFCSYWLASHRNPLRIMDHPNERSLHETPMPRIGGVAILFALSVGWTWVWITRGVPEIIGTGVISLICVAGISLLDDHNGVSPLVRLLIQGVAAAWLVQVVPGDWHIALGMWFMIVWLINLYNFMDGIDGLAGGMGVIGFGALGLIAWLNGHQLYAIYAWIVAAAATGFLILNWPPARIFMGDVGSASLGLLVSIFWLWGIKDKVFSFWLPLLVFSPFIFDATVTLVCRGCNGEKVWEAHRGHYYQRLVQLGWGHRKTAIFEYILMLICAAIALLLNYINDMLFVAGAIGLLAILYFTCAYGIKICEQAMRKS